MPSAPKRFPPPGPAGPPAKRFEHRDLTHRRLYDGRWERASKRFRRRHPLCARCATLGRVSPAEVVDHVVPHRGDAGKFWDQDNWQPLCARCHNLLTAACDGAFGNPARPKPNYHKGEPDTPAVAAFAAQPAATPN